ncbi:MAG: magnesium transporter CorA family protein [Candidatus Delongbacteria bacterium]|nr:magnesium transporter CorA family protein [Candidatus Delongbacteria bacterium]MBN2835911.1 magnesium transporter CorA family protein [Candidatus Delongbacteria bacterium]
MYTIYKKFNNTLKQIDNIEKDCWIKVVSPTEKEMDFFTETLDLPRDYFTDLLDVDEIARFEPEDRSFFIVIRIPVITTRGDEVEYNTIPLGIIIIPDRCIITVSYKDNEIIDTFINIKNRIMDTEKRDRSLLQIISRSVSLFITFLKQIRQQSNMIEKDLESQPSNDTLVKLFSIEKYLIHFRTSLRTNLVMVDKLRKSKLFKLNESDEDLLDDIIIDFRQAVEMAEIYSKIMNEMMAFFSSIINNNLNTVMKLLTSITIIIAIPTLISSIYGMNIELPLQHTHYAFFIIMGVAAFSAIAGVLLFIFRKWI